VCERAHLSSSGGISSLPAARPFFSFFIALITSSNVGSSVHMSGDGIDDKEAASSLAMVLTKTYNNQDKQKNPQN